MNETFRESFLTAPVFVQRAYAALETLDSKGLLTGSRSVEVKELVEEVLPVAAFLKHFETPMKPVRCRYAGGDSEYDAEIKVSGAEVNRSFCAPHYYLEVTSAMFQREDLRREALSRYGGVFMGPKIWREGSKKLGGDRIVSKPTVEDGDTAITNAIAWVTRRLSAKAKKVYPQPCFLLVNLKPDNPLPIYEWYKVAKGVRGAVARDRFKATFIIDWRRNVVFQL